MTAPGTGLDHGLAAGLDTVAQARALLEAGATSTELVGAALARATEVEHLAAFASVDGERALARAARLDGAAPLGPLHGVPIVLKDNVAQAGLANRAGSRVLPDVPAPADATVTARLEAAGAVVVGRTNMHELAWGGTTDNPHLGTCRNPWDPARVAAGSSGGTAAAVAAGVVPVGIGTDTGGSVRLPSAVTNLTGLRPTLGAIPTDGVVPLAWTLDTVGPMGRSAADCLALWDVIADAPAGRPSGAQVPVPLVPADGGPADAPFAGLRVGVLTDHALRDLQPGVELAVLGLLGSLLHGGAVVEEVALPDLELMVDALVVVDAAEPSAVHARSVRDHPELIGADVLAQLLAGAELGAVEYLQAQRFRTHLGAHLERLWSRVDVLVSPTLPFTAPLVGERLVTINGVEVDNLRANMRFTSLPSLTGCPAVSLPAGFDEAGLPVGAQLVAAPGRDRDLLLLAARVQEVTDHHRRRPPSSASSASSAG
ncbi:amidase [Litorihabitans aurantiacus]|uniref:Amidase n=1 Tax=Litorihabitans aurantiacus TaxID=1930061 RepID=A0AA37XIL3_9MICO|nr:amidase [Litorihabitans aurantiacus]GMA33155.1 amidase [Litorihabitans aurantiacus]